MSKNGFGKSGNSLLRRRWLVQDRKRKERQMLDKKKAAIAEQVKHKLESEAESAEKDKRGSNPCDGRPVEGDCVYTSCA